jgi:uncharacterized membrane protein YkoI
MMTSRLLLLSAAVSGLCMAVATPALAKPRMMGLTWQPQSTDALIMTQARQLSLREVVEIIEAVEPGRLSDAKLVSENGRAVYQIRWEPSREDVRGRILFFTVDAETGQILSRRGG